MEISRPKYLNELISMKHNNLIKVITGARRTGKSYLLFVLFYRHLIESGVKDDHIIRIVLDTIKDREYTDPLKLYDYINSRITNKDENYYILIDELQFAISDEEIKSGKPLLIYSVLNEFIANPKLDVYVTGSNSQFLSSDIMTEFRGRSDNLLVLPLSFKEFISNRESEDINKLWYEYMLYGGLPGILQYTDNTKKMSYLKNIVKETYERDIIERYNLKGNDVIDSVLKILSSSIGSLTNPKKLADTFNSNGLKTSPMTISSYIDYLIDAFIIDKVQRYDIKGKKYINSPYKFYFSDLGIRNSLLDFRQIEETYSMENIIYNELINRGYRVDVGLVEVESRDNNGKHIRNKYEVDFICNLGTKRYYIQSAFSLPSLEKQAQEEKSLDNIKDGFKCIIITKDSYPAYYNEKGYLILNLFDFLLNENSLEQ